MALFPILTISQVTLALALIENPLKLLPAEFVIIFPQMIHHELPGVEHVMSSGIAEIFNSVDVFLSPVWWEVGINLFLNVRVALVQITNSQESRDKDQLH